jgi:hypothetical protein
VNGVEPDQTSDRIEYADAVNMHGRSLAVRRQRCLKGPEDHLIDWCLDRSGRTGPQADSATHPVGIDLRNPADNPHFILVRGAVLKDKPLTDILGKPRANVGHPAPQLNGLVYQLSAPVGIRIGPGEQAQVLHRDDAVYPLPEPRPPVVVNTMWPLDEYTADNGATRFIPGSHRWEPGRRPADDDAVLTATMAPGSVMFYLGSLWHGGGANRTGQPRLGVILEYAASWLRPQENQSLAVPRGVVRQLPERLQELLGYNIYPPFLGYVDGTHPRRVLSTGD